MQIHLTVEEVAKKIGVSRDVAYRFVVVLRELKLAEVVGLRRKEGSKGKGADVYFLDTDKVAETMAASIRKLESLPTVSDQPLDVAPTAPESADKEPDKGA